MKALERMGRECSDYFEVHGRFTSSVCRSAAEDLKHAFIKKALLEKYADYIKEVKKHSALGGQEIEILDFEEWIAEKTPDELIAIAKPGFKDAILKTGNLKKIFFPAPSDEEKSQAPNPSKRGGLVAKLTVISAAITATVAGALQIPNEKISSFLDLLRQALQLLN